MLGEMSNRDTVRLHITTPGGQLGSGLKMCTAIQECRAEVTAVLSGSVASAGTIIALACDKIECDFSLEFMIHYFSSSGGQGKGHEIKAYQKFSEKHMPVVFKNAYAGFLTDSEIEDVINGQDIYLDGNEVVERFRNRMVA
jgi:ATP-dependent protease ClpP protease subunit